MREKGALFVLKKPVRSNKAAKIRDVRQAIATRYADYSGDEPREYMQLDRAAQQGNPTIVAATTGTTPWLRVGRFPELRQGVCNG